MEVPVISLKLRCHLPYRYCIGFYIIISLLISIFVTIFVKKKKEFKDVLTNFSLFYLCTSLAKF